MKIIIKRAPNLLRQLSKELSKSLTQTVISLLTVYDSFLIWGNRKSAVHGERVVWWVGNLLSPSTRDDSSNLTPVRRRTMISAVIASQFQSKYGVKFWGVCRACESENQRKLIMQSAHSILLGRRHWVTEPGKTQWAFRTLMFFYMTEKPPLSRVCSQELTTSRWPLTVGHHLTKRFHFNVGLIGIISQMTSKC